MVLKHIYLYLNLEEYADEISTTFGFRTRYVCNFLERVLRPLKFSADGFSKICVQGRHVADESCPIVPENAALPSVHFDQRLYETLGTGERHEFFLEMLVHGLEKCARFHSIPLRELREGVDAFRKQGYRNEWIHQQKNLRPLGVLASLECSLDQERFVLTLCLERKGATVFEEAILETKPDEIIFGYRFKDIVVADKSIIVRDKFGHQTFRMEGPSFH